MITDIHINTNRKNDTSLAIRTKIISILIMINQDIFLIEV